jgi:hypothetical protein
LYSFLFFFYLFYFIEKKRQQRATYGTNPTEPIAQ